MHNTKTNTKIDCFAKQKGNLMLWRRKFFFYSTEQVPKQGASSGFNVGGNLNFDEHNHLLFSIGKGITNINLTNQRSIYLGYQWTW